MDWMQFVVSLLEHSAWPIAVVAVAILLRQQISELFARLEVFRHRETEFRFSEAVEDIEDSADESGPSYVEDERIASEVERLRQVAAIVPKAAISQAWNLVDREITDLLLGEGFRDTPKVRDVISTLKSSGLSNRRIEQIKDLRNVRNRVMHRKGIDMDIEHVKSFIELSADAAAAVHALRSNN